MRSKRERRVVYVMRSLVLPLFLFCTPLFCYADGSPHLKESAFSQREGAGYTINFNDVSIIEYIKFIGKIGKINFLYNEEELQFHVTIISEEPTQLVDIMGALTQVLKVNGFSLIEQGNNLLIVKTGTAKQIAPVISETSPLEEGQKLLPIATRLFTLHNANPNHVANLIKPLLSADAIFTASTQTRHLIITDTVQNIEQIQQLLISLDAPQTHLEITSYTAQNNTPENLINATKEIIAPIAEAAPLTLVPQNQTKTIFIVSTPFLIEKALAILKDLDSAPSIGTKYLEPITGNNILIHHIEHKPAGILQSAIHQIEKNLKETGLDSENFLQSLKSMKYIGENHSLFFAGSPQSLKEIEAILKDLDIPYSENELEPVQSGFYIYKIQNGDEAQISRSLEKITDNLNASPQPCEELIQAIASKKGIEESHALIFTGDQRSLDQIRTLLPILDAPPREEARAKSDFYVYQPKYETGENLLKKMKEIGENLENAELADPPLLHTLHSASQSPANGSLLFTGDSYSLKRIRDLIPEVDRPKKSPEEGDSLFLYKVKFADPDDLEQELHELIKPLLQENPLVKAIKNAQYIEQSRTFVFKGPPPLIEQIEQILHAFDGEVEAQKGAAVKKTHFIYPLRSIPGGQMMKELEETGALLQSSDPEMHDVINRAHWIESAHSIILTGPRDAVEQVKALIEKYDTPRESPLFIYTPTAISAASFAQHLIETARGMEKEGAQDLSLIHTMLSATLTPNKMSVLFTGTPESISKLKTIVQSFDRVESKTSEFFLYKPLNISAEQLQKELSAAAKRMVEAGLDDPQLIQVMQSAHIDSSGQRITFTGTSEAISKIQTMVKAYDSRGELEKMTNFYLFTPSYQPPDFILQQALHTASEMQKSGLIDRPLIQALESGSIVSNNTSLLFTGTPDAIQRLKEIVPSLDVKKEAPLLATEFFVYKPLNITAEEVCRHAHTVAQNMENAGFSDLHLIQTLKTAHLVSHGKSVLFTGTLESIAKTRELAPSLDSPEEEEIKKVGETIFLIYKVKHTPGPLLIEHLKNLGHDLTRTGSMDEALVKTLNNTRYIKETDSIVFAGSAQAVEKARVLAEKFDIPTLVRETPVRTPAQFHLYKPKYVDGKALIQTLHDFEQNLVATGIDERGLFDVINNLRWMEKNGTLLISGEEGDTRKILNIIEHFDVPGSGLSQDGTHIASISDVSFFTYKLQYHAGPEIQDAIKKIGTNLVQSKSKDRENLVDAIHALQYIEATNSLISTGQPEALAKLQEIIKSVDTPLKQVFVEILVIETSTLNTLNFGLRWGSQGKYRDKFSYATGSFPVGTVRNPEPLASFNENLHNITATNTPTGGLIPFARGFGLGVIGDIITHKGASYFSLGNLINALKSDEDSTIVLNQKIITQDNKNSTLFIGQNIPYTGSLVKNAGSNVVQTANLEYRDIGVNLSITPMVGNDDIITLAINQNISEQASSSANSTALTDSITGITTNKATTQTVVSVPDQSFLILSGQIQNTKTHRKTGVPCLGSLPLLGAAFNERDKNRISSNIIIFIRPQLITSFETYREITDAQEELYKAQSHAEDFEGALDLVKTPYDE